MKAQKTMNIAYVRYRNGRVLEGLIPYLTADLARVAFRGRDDVSEFEFVGGQWLSEDCEPVVFEVPYAPMLQALLWTEDSAIQYLPSQIN
jgi:hypothetical protein